MNNPTFKQAENEQKSLYVIQATCPTELNCNAKLYIF